MSGPLKTYIFHTNYNKNPIQSHSVRLSWSLTVIVLSVFRLTSFSHAAYSPLILAVWRNRFVDAFIIFLSARGQSLHFKITDEIWIRNIWRNTSRTAIYNWTDCSFIWVFNFFFFVQFLKLIKRVCIFMISCTDLIIGSKNWKISLKKKKTALFFDWHDVRSNG